jgi:hypothetical protein
MSEIQDINLNKFELKLADTEDPVAQKVSWNPHNPGGSNFRTQDLVVSNDKIRIVKSRSMNLLAVGSVVAGIIGLVAGFNMLFSEFLIFGVFLMVWGGGFGGLAYFVFIKSSPNFTIDTFNGTYCVGDEFDNVNKKDRMVQGYLKDIHATQLIEERISSKSSDGRRNSYNSYEMNLVFKDGERLNIMDHGSREDVDASAIKLGGILNIPIWKAQY